MLNTELIKSALIDSIQLIYNDMLDSSIEVEKEQLKTIETLPDLIQISIDMTFSYGKEIFNQPFILTFPLQTYLNIAGIMFMDEYHELNEEIEEVGLELSNMVLGRAKQKISHELNAKFEMTRPLQITNKLLPQSIQSKKCNIISLYSKLGTSHLIIAH
jgi:CheY-specific phosphatase CheX